MGIVIAIPIVAVGPRRRARAPRSACSPVRPGNGSASRCSPGSPWLLYRAARLARTRANDRMKRLESKLPAVGTTIFTVMTQLADEHGAVNLSQGFPELRAAGRAASSASSTISRTRCHQYAPMPGSVPLRAAIAAKLEDLYGVTRRSGHRDHGHERRDRGDLLRDPGRRAPRRRGDRARSVLRLVRAVGHARGRPRRPRLAGAADVRDRLGAPCGRVLEAHAARDREHAAQSGGHGALGAPTSIGSPSSCARTTAIS